MVYFSSSRYDAFLGVGADSQHASRSLDSWLSLIWGVMSHEAIWCALLPEEGLESIEKPCHKDGCNSFIFPEDLGYMGTVISSFPPSLFSL